VVRVSATTAAAASKFVVVNPVAAVMAVENPTAVVAAIEVVLTLTVDVARMLVSATVNKPPAPLNTEVPERVPLNFHARPSFEVNTKVLPGYTVHEAFAPSASIVPPTGGNTCAAFAVAFVAVNCLKARLKVNASPALATVDMLSAF
jgi:hypothetical protein